MNTTAVMIIVIIITYYYASNVCFSVQIGIKTDTAKFIPPMYTTLISFLLMQFCPVNDQG